MFRSVHGLIILADRALALPDLLGLLLDACELKLRQLIVLLFLPTDLSRIVRNLSNHRKEHYEVQSE